MQIETGLPAGRVVYADTGAWKTVERPLFSALHQLAGKPDYVVKQGRQTIPIEVKSANAPGDGPRRSHLLQLAAYCLLIEEHYQHRPEYGIIKYADRAFEIDYTPALETALLDTLDAMRADLTEGAATRSHHDAGRCLHCGYRHACDEHLV
jgi:CRISPR-associated exonuclease Cas4